MSDARWIGLLGGLFLAAAMAWAAQAPPPTSTSGPATRGAAEDPKAVWESFNAFCQRFFGAQKEPLIYERFGKDLVVVASGGWTHVSRNSAAVAWETSLPARTHVEYGPDATYGQTTAEPERHYYLHLHHLRGLRPSTTYHYRLVSVDERGNRLVGPDQTFQTLAQTVGVSLPGDRAGPPYVLDQPGVYVLTQDVTADGTAFEITAGDVTLDLNAHTVVYNNAPMGKIDGDGWAYLEKSATGVRVGRRNLKNVRVLNGLVRQGAGGDSAQDNGTGFSPVASHSGGAGELAGLSVQYYGGQVCGLYLPWGPAYDVHHNVVADHGTEIHNRHQGCAAIKGTPSVHHNLVTRARHRGIDAISNSQVYANELYIDSCATNSAAIGWYKGRKASAHHNRVFGTGYLAIGIAAVSEGVGDIRVHDNLIHLQAAAPSSRWTEYGEQSGAYCFRITWGGENIEVFDNLMVTHGRDGGMIRGIWHCPQPDIRNVVYRNNIIKAIADNDASTIHGAIVICGDSKGSPDAPTVFRDNVVLSNLCNVRFGEDYGSGNNTRFFGNTFVRVGDRKDYCTIRIGHGGSPTFGHEFYDSTFQGGAGLDVVRFEGQSDRREFFVGTTVAVKTAAGAAVTVRDAAGAEVFSGQAGADGALAVPVRLQRRSPRGLTDLGPLTFTANRSGKTVSAVLAAGAATIDLPMPGGAP